MSEFLNIGVIGLGVMGQRMLGRLAGHALLRPTLVWDANPAAVAHAVKTWPQLRAAESAEALIAAPELRSLYIATPPEPHIRLSELAFDAGLAVLCEKPLTVDLDAARRCIARIDAQGQRAAVNFPLASSPGLALLQTHFGAAARLPMGALTEVELELAFAEWPRPWQSAAGAWLAEREEGGFTREVMSHFIFALQRVLGPCKIGAHMVTYPEDGPNPRLAETGVRAEFHAAGVPVRISGRVGGEVADHNRMSWRTNEGEIELSQWFSDVQQHRYDGKPLGDSSTLRSVGQADQLSQWAAMIEGRSHSLPGFAEALAVQETIEALLKT